MKKCPITYDILTKNDPNPYSVTEQRQEAILRASKISIQGVQLKLSASLSIKKEVFEFSLKGGAILLNLPMIFGMRFLDLDEIDIYHLLMESSGNVRVQIQMSVCRSIIMVYFGSVSVQVSFLGSI